jgi:hypothetical protein
MMTIARNTLKLIALVLLALLASCNSTDEGTYRGGVLIQPGPLGIQDHYAFRFADKWRISHAWLSGPVDIDYCRYSRRDAQFEDRFFEVDGVMKEEYVSYVPKDKGKKFISDPANYVYGTDPRTVEFKGYHSFCTHTFQDIWTGVSVFLIKPDSAKGTDEWIAGAKPVVVNGLHWLRKNIPIEDYSKNHEKWAAPIEIWVLKIPDTPYWLVMRIHSSTGGTGTSPGRNRNPEKFARVLDLFHQMIESVRLDAIAPADTSTLSTQRKP